MATWNPAISAQANPTNQYRFQCLYRLSFLRCIPQDPQETQKHSSGSLLWMFLVVLLWMFPYTRIKKNKKGIMCSLVYGNHILQLGTSWSRETSRALMKNLTVALYWILGFTAIIARVSDIFVNTVYLYIYTIYCNNSYRYRYRQKYRYR